MDERLRFVARLLDGERMAELCREFGISRKTGYKIFTRYKDIGLEGLTDRSRRPYRQANRLPFQVETLILGLKREHPSWGAPKIRAKLRRRFPDIKPPAISTVHAVLDRNGLVSHGRERRYHAQGTSLSVPTSPNDLWCADFKGEFMLADKRYCYPLTITDFASRYGAPFASASAIFGLSKLSVWWLRLGIGLERIQPGKPTQNGRHERMHLTLKKETTKPAANNFLQQQEKFDRFIECYNQQRPHQAIEMHYPGELYRPSERAYHGLDPLEYPFHDRTVAVTMCGRVCFGSRKINLSTVFAGQNVGVKEVDEKVWLISFMHYDLGFFDHESSRFECAENPFEAKVLPMSSE
jgi:putative transposase